MTHPPFVIRSRHVVILGTLAAAAVLAWRPRAEYALIVPALLAAALVWRWPALGPVGLLVVALVTPFALGTGTQTALPLAFLLVPALAGLWLAKGVLRRGVRLPATPATLPLVGLIVVVSLAWLAGYLPWNPFAQLAPLRAQAGEWGVFVFSALAFWLAAASLREVRWLKTLTYLFLALGAVYLLGRAAQPYWPPAAKVVGLFPVGATGSLLWTWLAALAAGLAVFDHDLRPALRAALFGLIALLFAVAWGQGRGWASGWLPPLAAVLVILFLRSPRFGLFWGTLLVVGFILNLSRLKGVVLVENQLYSWDTRLAAWEILLNIARASPVIGLGPANYYFYTPLYPILGYYVNFNSHNNYMDLLLQTGALGLGLFLWFAAAVGREAWAARANFKLQTSNFKFQISKNQHPAVNSQQPAASSQRQIGMGFECGYAHGALAGLVGTLAAGMLGDWFLPFVYNVGIAGFRASLLAWLFLGGLVALRSCDSRS